MPSAVGRWLNVKKNTLHVERIETATCPWGPGNIISAACPTKGLNECYSEQSMRVSNVYASFLPFFFMSAPEGAASFVTTTESNTLTASLAVNRDCILRLAFTSDISIKHRHKHKCIKTLFSNPTDRSSCTMILALISLSLKICSWCSYLCLCSGRLWEDMYFMLVLILMPLVQTSLKISNSFVLLMLVLVTLARTCPKCFCLCSGRLWEDMCFMLVLILMSLVQTSLKISNSFVLFMLVLASLVSSEDAH